MYILSGTRRLEVYFDGNCGVCGRLTSWLERQDCHLDMVILPYAGIEAKRLFPEIDEYEPDKLMVTRTNTGRIYRGAESWVMCFWALKKYRWLARVLGNCVILPFVKIVAWLVARNRYRLGKMLFGKSCECGMRKK